MLDVAVEEIVAVGEMVFVVDGVLDAKSRAMLRPRKVMFAIPASLASQEEYAEICTPLEYALDGTKVMTASYKKQGAVEPPLSAKNEFANT